ncbi:uncharacterized protein N7482_005338 [Penicillium canariense]|uniref:Uncharacterized protein n=1 Tax=Penicillium canariense TaxID=189055 RepID=A0A9W9LMG6_9EURO|nr:uncharacterized protein N7482_005338 [Penicillium canariense]KAJ5166557.1 hypothetical protein N7482_005338 [Penicillium canariense]
MHLGSCFKSSRAHLLLLLLALLSLISLTQASTPTSFCKCTCFSNSTIIPLDPGKSSSSSALDHVYNLYERAFASPDLDLASTPESKSETDSEAPAALTERASKYRALSCNDCNRKFCLDYELPICKDAKEEDVFTTCFQRDSRKDEAVVFIFIFATGGLLTWALLKPWIERYIEAARERRSYMPVAEPDS